MPADSHSTKTKARILLIAHNFPPTQGPESSLVKLNTLDLLRRGWRLSVITTTMEHMHQGLDSTMLEGLPADLEVVRAPSYDAVFRRRWPRVARYALALLTQWVLPEIFLFWLPASVPAGKRWLRKNGPAIIYSRATKHVSNITGWCLKRATGLPWVAHYSDPWLGKPAHNAVQVWLGRRFEKRIFKDADALVFVNNQLAELYLSEYPAARAKTHVIPHGYAPLTSRPAAVTGAGTRPLQILHAGAFVSGLRDPDKLFEALVLLSRRRPLLNRVKLTFVGEDTVRYQAEVDAMGLSGVITLLSSVPYPECQRMISQSDLLLVVDTPRFGGIYLPTKLVEYLAHEKRVLGLTEPGSAVQDVLDHCGLAWADQMEPEKIANAIEKLLADWERGDWSLPEAFVSRAASYRIDIVNKKLDDLLGSFSGKMAEAAEPQPGFVQQ